MNRGLRNFLRCHHSCKFPTKSAIFGPCQKVSRRDPTFLPVDLLDLLRVRDGLNNQPDTVCGKKTEDSRKITDTVCVSPSILHIMAISMYRHDRNGHITGCFFHCYPIISPSSKVMVRQCFQHISTTLFRNKKHDTRHGKNIQHDRSYNISHRTYYF